MFSSGDRRVSHVMYLAEGLRVWSLSDCCCDLSENFVVALEFIVLHCLIPCTGLDIS